MDLFDEIAAERRGLADMLSGLTEAQRTTSSLCSEWTVQDVVGHLIVPLEVGVPRFGLAIVRALGNFDTANSRLARRQAQRPFDEIIDVLRRKADKRFTPPGMGPEAPLTDLLVHGLDIRWPLGLNREIPQDRMRTALQFVANAGAGNVVAKGVLDGLRFEATDLDWAHGTGRSVSGQSDAVLLAMAGRPAALEQLDGEGVETLATRLA
ncbi:MAG: maleylpyruvate isomerase family mycothiol-dependent enzyme [Microthrixaceae bacterium]